MGIELGMQVPRCMRRCFQRGPYAIVIQKSCMLYSFSCSHYRLRAHIRKSLGNWPGTGGCHRIPDSIAKHGKSRRRGDPWYTQLNPNSFYCPLANRNSEAGFPYPNNTLSSLSIPHFTRLSKPCPFHPIDELLPK